MSLRIPGELMYYHGLEENDGSIRTVVHSFGEIVKASQTARVLKAPNEKNCQHDVWEDGEGRIGPLAGQTT